jgi:broad specificity phosphatase PhoE
MILLIRHGETAFNAARIVQPADTPLSERGLRQAERVAARVAQLGGALVLSSDLARARTTAEVIAAHIAVPLELSSLLQERNFGDLRGTPYDKLDHDIFAPEFVPPGGESNAQLEARTAQAFALVLQKLDKLAGNLVVVTHGLVCAALVRAHAKLGDLPAIMSFANASLTRIERAAPHRVLELNDVAHLAELETRGAAV